MRSSGERAIVHSDGVELVGGVEHRQQRRLQLKARRGEEGEGRIRR
jgi:hypothetical protein